MSKLKKKLVSAGKEVRKLDAKIKEFTQKQGEFVDPSLHSGLLSVMKDSTDYIKKAYPEGTFARHFWEEQLKAASAKDSRQVRWHPLKHKAYFQ